MKVMFENKSLIYEIIAFIPSASGLTNCQNIVAVKSVKLRD